MHAKTFAISAGTAGLGSMRGESERDRIAALIATPDAKKNHWKGENLKKTGLAGLIMTLCTAAHASGYVEVWNPPEARASAPRKSPDARKSANHRHGDARAVKVHMRRNPRPAPALVAKQGRMQQAVPTQKPDMSEIPRQITPEGNVLRVTTRAADVGVVR
jgi:hypothetical protein